MKITFKLPSTNGNNCPQCGVTFSNGEEFDKVRYLCHLHNRWECMKCGQADYAMKYPKQIEL